MNIKKVIKDNGQSVSSVAAVLGVSQSSLSQQLANGTNISLGRALEIAKIVGVPLSVLVADETDSDYPKQNNENIICPHCGKPISMHVHIDIE